MAFPYGLLADRRGRKSTLALGLPGFAVNSIITIAVMWFSDIFPLRAIWLSSLGWLIGGGPVVAFAIIWTMMADVTTESERYAHSRETRGIKYTLLMDLFLLAIELLCFSNSALSQWVPILSLRQPVHG